MSSYTFSVSLLDASVSPGLAPWQSGTMTLDTASPQSLTGVLSVPGFYSEPIPLAGSTTPPGSLAGETAILSGKSTQAEVTVSLAYNYDGFLFNGSYLGGLVNLLDYGAQEAYLYVLQGVSPDGPAGAEYRAGSRPRQA